jgi:hypothetical protein
MKPRALLVGIVNSAGAGWAGADRAQLGLAKRTQASMALRLPERQRICL